MVVSVNFRKAIWHVWRNGDQTPAKRAVLIAVMMASIQSARSRSVT